MTVSPLAFKSIPPGPLPNFPFYVAGAISSFLFIAPEVKLNQLHALLQDYESPFFFGPVPLLVAES